MHEVKYVEATVNSKVSVPVLKLRINTMPTTTESAAKLRENKKKEIEESK